jgi:hypothetical protein
MLLSNTQNLRDTKFALSMVKKIFSASGKEVSVKSIAQALHV